MLYAVYTIITAFAVATPEIIIVLPIVWIASLPAIPGFYLFFEWMGMQQLNKIAFMLLSVTSVMIITFANSFALIWLIGALLDKAQTIQDSWEGWVSIWQFSMSPIIASGIATALAYRYVSALIKPCPPISTLTTALNQSNNIQTI